MIALAIYTGLRLGVVVSLSRACDKGQWLETVQSKNRKPVTAYICPDLRAILDAIDYSAPVEATTLCVKSNGQPWAYEGIKTAFQRNKAALEAQGKLMPGVTFDGLRHTPATILAESGFREDEFAHFLGHAPRTISGHYARSAKHNKLLTDMALAIQNTLRNERGNVLILRKY